MSDQAKPRKKWPIGRIVLILSAVAVVCMIPVGYQMWIAVDWLLNEEGLIQIAYAMHEYHDEHQHFPAPAIFADDHGRLQLLRDHRGDRRRRSASATLWIPRLALFKTTLHGWPLIPDLRPAFAFVSLRQHRPLLSWHAD